MTADILYYCHKPFCWGHRLIVSIKTYLIDVPVAPRDPGMGGLGGPGGPGRPVAPVSPRGPGKPGCPGLPIPVAPVEPGIQSAHCNDQHFLQMQFSLNYHIL